MSGYDNLTNTVAPIEYGVPVRSPGACSLYAGRDAVGNSCLYGVMGQETESGALFLLRIDPGTGAVERFDAPQGYNGCRSALWSDRWNRLFMYANICEHVNADHIRLGSGLLVFDPLVSEIVEIATPGQSNEESLSAISIAESPDGAIWLGSYSSCEISRFDPASGKLHSIGRADDVDQYPYIMAGDDGTIAVLIKMTRPHVVVLDRASNTFIKVGPVADVQAQQGFVELHKRADGNLYISSHEGAFRISGTVAEPIDRLPAAASMPTLPDGSTYRFLDGHAEMRHTYRHVGVTTPQGELRILKLDYQANGTAIYLVRNGPDGRLYGSSVLPLHFFACDTDGANMVDYGAASTASGEVYSMDHMDRKIYFCSYTRYIGGL